MWNFIKYNLIGVVNTLITLMVVWVLYELLHWNLELSNYNTRGRAAEVLVDNDQAYLIRERERLEDLFANEKVVSFDEK